MSKEIEIDLVGTQSTDAQEWASEFMRLFGHRKEDIDKDLMITWFANALVVASESVNKDYALGVALASGSYIGEFQKQYLGNWDTPYEVLNNCGDCAAFGEQGCKTSRIEAKYGTASTPACEDFKRKDNK